MLLYVQVTWSFLLLSGVPLYAMARAFIHLQQIVGFEWVSVQQDKVCKKPRHPSKNKRPEDLGSRMTTGQEEALGGI